MKIKASLHIHTAEDFKEGGIIDYSIFELIDQAKLKGFKALALTCHWKNVIKEEYIKYARERGILLIPGVEVSIRNPIGEGHVLILNARSDINTRHKRTFEELAAYRKKYPDTFVIAAHPNYGFKDSLGLKLLRKYINLFDGVEHSWFYTKSWNLNRKTEKVARELKKPFIATADIHSLDFFDDDYTVIEAKELTMKAIFQALKDNKFKNYTRPKIWSELFNFFFPFLFKYICLKIKKLFGVKSSCSH